MSLSKYGYKNNKKPHQEFPDEAVHKRKSVILPTYQHDAGSPPVKLRSAVPLEHVVE
jgi:hypothetical protein